MKVSDLVKISRDAMKMMSSVDIKIGDWQHLGMYEEYLAMRDKCEKFRYIMAFLAEKYKMSESTVRRVIKRFSREVIF